MTHTICQQRGGGVFLDSLTGRRTPSWRSTAGSSATEPWTCTSNTNAAPLGPGHPQQRLHPGRGQPRARAERAGRAGEAQQAVGDGGGRFRTSGTGIRTKAGVIRANAARYPISAQYRIPGVPRSTYYWMTEHPEAEPFPRHGRRHGSWRRRWVRPHAERFHASLTDGGDPHGEEYCFICR